MASSTSLKLSLSGKTCIFLIVLQSILFFPGLCRATSLNSTLLKQSKLEDEAFSKAIINSLSLLADDTSPSEASGQNDYTCAPDRPCVNGACCGKDGWCGYGPKFCGDGCQADCDATAECGEFASTANATCPLNVCCSEYGFCGTTEEFCQPGCQSNCEQPKPSGSPSNVQKRVIGYWEGWNSQKACGTMGIGEIPVQALTHLIVAFAYVSPEFKITNMDGLASDVYRDVGNVKYRNPKIKVMVALGGWTFSDPGPWQSVFPDMTSSKENRATFIQNLLGFLNEYGYDGVDFDWEYPGADDRGGSKADAANYVYLVKELRQAIDNSGKSFIVTFTAPTSYWYLRHFDIAGMEKYVDWINLMSYDLHGVWDSSNPIGNQVLAHTNLTEIDQALNLFWRIDVKPSSIALGLGFYGRSFTLEDSSCWKPGCAFSGPGAAGKCSATPGILSYREIQDIIAETGATAYLDKEAAARYVVYDDSSWISFDDETTFQAKIEYANKLGLSGLMIWAVDLDDGKLTALNSISDGSLIDSGSASDLVNLDYIFPEDIRPAKSDAKFNLVQFGDSSGSLDPSGSAFGMVVSGNGSSTFSRDKRDVHIPLFTFLDCPSDVNERELNETQTARIACFDEDIDDCFKLFHDRAHDVVIEMPEDCASGSHARILSLESASDKTVPTPFAKRHRSSRIYDLNFDFDVPRVKRDNNKGSIRADYSNAADYWDKAVDSPGDDSTSTDHKKRFEAAEYTSWRRVYTEKNLDVGKEGTSRVHEDISAPLFWQETPSDCQLYDDNYDEAVGAYVVGDFEADFWYGFSLVAEYDDENGLEVRQADGFLQVEGTSDVTFGLGGIGTIQGSYHNFESLTSEPDRVSLGGHDIPTSHDNGHIHFEPWYSIHYQMDTIQGIDDPVADGPVAINGNLSVRAITDFGGFRTTFPDPHSDQSGIANKDREDTKVEISTDNVLYTAWDEGGSVLITTILRFGLAIEYRFHGGDVKALPNIYLDYSTGASFDVYPSKDDERMSCAGYELRNTVTGFTYGASSAHWGDDGTINLGGDDHDVSGKCYNNLGEGIMDERSLPPEIEDIAEPELGPRQSWDQAGFINYRPGTELTPTMVFSTAIGSMFSDYARPTLSSRYPNSISCTTDDDNLKCCGCTSMLYTEGIRDIPVSYYRLDYDGLWPFGRRNQVEIKAYEVTTSPKKVTVFTAPYWLNMPYLYPSYPTDDTKVWSTMDGGKWADIKHYGNKSYSCTDWGIQKTDFPSHEVVDGSVEQADYQTEHVFEGQLIGDFMEWWLVQGHIHNQAHMTSAPQPKQSRQWVQQHMMNDMSWSVKNVPKTNVFRAMLAELGSLEHPDRLTALLTRPNGKKGAMFSGNSPISREKYLTQTMEKQILGVKEMGMVFSYLNDDDVWKKFCDTYEAIRKVLVDFDARYKKNGYGNSNLTKEWEDYIKEVIKSLGVRSRDDFRYYYIYNRASRKDEPFYTMWNILLHHNSNYLEITGECPTWAK